MPTILIVDDEKNIRASLARSLRLEGYATLEAADGAQALDRLESDEIDLVILDLQMPVLDGIGLLEKLAARSRKVPSLVLTAHGTIETAVRAVKLGALDFIEKPPAVERILLAVSNALRLTRLEEENRRLAEESGLGGRLLGTSPPMRRLAETIARVAPTDAGILLVGENGTGKELVARAIHEQSARRERPLVTVNCAAIPETLFESELFGHAKGAFTGALENRRGKFQQGDGGTIFLDEIGELPPALQPKMLRVLDSGEIERVGGRSAERVNARLIAATNRDLEAEVAAGRFRQDLYYRLLVVQLTVPPLRERREDIPLLARHFLEAACRRNRIHPKPISEPAMAMLEGHDWPGNVRELRNAMERIAILVADDVVRDDHLKALQTAGPTRATGRAGAGAAATVPAAGTPGGADGTGGRARAEASGTPLDLATQLIGHEKAIILAALERHRWRMSRAARELNLERSHLYKKMKALGIERPADD
ncbi:MAG: Fis family transcriptional regulator [Acidobacteria bacterium]|nr:MAG: Fis family transcriptional regulator [Acidobacteriota bacterium]